MPKKRNISLILAVSGALLVWLTLLSPLFLGLANVVFRQGIFRLDYLMPAEFFPVALLGGILLLLAAISGHARRSLVGWALVVAVISLVSGQGLAVISGLASGETEPASIWGAVVIATLVIYVLALLALGIGGLQLTGELLSSTTLAE